LGGQVVNLIRLDLLDKINYRKLVEKVGLMERNPVTDMLNPAEVSVEARRTMPKTSYPLSKRNSAR
jgi:hypothetical protein